MADKLLSQPEIEALMSTLAAEPDPTTGKPVAVEPAPPARPVKLYDFRRPDKFSKDHLRALRQIHEVFARGLVSSLASYLRTAIQIRLTLVEQVPYNEYLGSLMNPTVVWRVNPAPLPSQLLMELNLPVARVILDRLLGGSGLLANATGDLTEIEMALLDRVGGYLLGSLRDAWQSLIPLEPTTQAPALSAEFIQGTLQTETTVMLTFEVALLKTTGTMSICIPHPVLQPIMEKLSAQAWAGGAAQTAERRALEQPDQLSPVALPLTVELGETEMLLRDLVNLAPGEVIRLDTPATGDLRVRVGEHVKFAGRPGVVRRNLAVQITRALA